MPYYFYGDSTFLWLLPAVILALIAQARVQGAYNKYSRVPTSGGWTGATLAQALLSQRGGSAAKVELTQGQLSDHYDPRTDTVRLSREVYQSTSIAALGIAAHEVGHAFQHQGGYLPIKLRSAIVPVANIGSHLSVPLLLLGLFMRNDLFINIGLIAFALTTVFTLITLPVEFNASRRAMTALEQGGYLTRDELPGARSVLSAAALTYVASALMALLQFVRLLSFSGRRRD